MNKVYRNTRSFKMMARGSFALFVISMLVSSILLKSKEPLMVKGYYLMGCVGLILSSFMVSKLVRDNQKMRKTITNSLPQKLINNRRSLKRLFLFCRKCTNILSFAKQKCYNGMRGSEHFVLWYRTQCLIRLIIM